MANVGEICSRDVVIMGRDESIREAARLMREFHAGDVIVVDYEAAGNRPAGILTDRDIVVEIFARDADPDSVAAGDAMSYELVVVEQDTGIYETIELMRARGVRRCPVVSGEGLLVGIVTFDDLLEFVAEQLSGIVGILRLEQEKEQARRTAP